MSLLSQLKILVAGAATGGAATALLLARAGAQVTIVERVREPRAIGAGLALAANGRAVLDALGLGPALETARMLTSPRITDARGRTIALPPAGSGIAVVTRARLQEVLIDALLAEPRVTCRFGVTLERAKADGTVVLRDETITNERFDLVIGADGVHSRVRASGDFGARLTETGIRYLRALVAVKVAEATEAWTPAGVFGAVPVEGGTYIYASCGTAALARAVVARDLDALRDAWGEAYAPARALLAGVARFEDLLVHEVLRVDCARWSSGRVVLLGDAAHAMAPNLGQGANSALVDAVVLVDSLRSATDLDSGLRAYEARRRANVRRVAERAGQLGRLAEQVHPVVRAMRDRVLMPVLARLPQEGQLNMLLQEPPEALYRMGRAR